MSYWSDDSEFLSTPDEQLIYDHLLFWVQVETPEQILQRFRNLFLNGLGYSDYPIQSALDRITSLPNARHQFLLFFNRCCYTVINHWQSRLHYQDAVPDFLAMLQSPLSLPTAGLGRSQSVKRLRLLVKSFTESEHFFKLRRLTEFFIDDDQDAQNSRQASRPLVSLIRRYPYLYSHCLISDESSEIQKQSIRMAQQQMQKRFEVNLSQYLTFELRRGHHSGNPIQTVKNPTLLNDGEVRTAIKQFVGRAEGGYSYKDQAHRFLAQTSQVHSYQSFRADFYEYLTASNATQYGGGRFSKQLQHYLDCLPLTAACQPFNDFLMVRTCNQMLNYLVVESSQNPSHYVLVDLLNNLGTPATIGLLLKIVLVCKKVKPYLEKRFAILFNHYEGHSRGTVQWLVSCLEHLNIAWSTQFGAVDFSFASQLVR